MDDVAFGYPGHPHLVDSVRTAVDESLRECCGYTLDITKSGHVELVDGDIDTGDVAASIIEKMAAQGWIFALPTHFWPTKDNT